MAEAHIESVVILPIKCKQNIWPKKCKQTADNLLINYYPPHDGEFWGLIMVSTGFIEIRSMGTPSSLATVWITLVLIP